jgi:HEPN domain-containing protein
MTTPPDAERVAETAAWLRRASSDMRAATGVLTLEPPLLDDAVFHCQQAVEKSLKAFLAWHDQPFRKTHDLGALGQQCVEIDPTLESLLREAAPLTEYAWKFRYPGEPEEPTVEEAQQAMLVTHQVASAIIDRLPREARVG